MAIFGLRSIIKREFVGYFQSPVAYIFIATFLIVGGGLTFFSGEFFYRGVADLEPFFVWHPWLYMFLIPAITMRLWAEEKQNGTMELLLSFPVPIWQLVVGKFIAAWLFTSLALAGTLPIWWTVNYLGNPDNGLIIAGYIGSLLMAGGYVAIGACISAATASQVTAFVLSLCVCLFFTITGFPMVMGLAENWLPQLLVETIGQFSFITNFEDITKGVLGLRVLFYFFSLIVLWLFLNLIAVERRRV